jgi:PAS fold
MLKPAAEPTPLRDGRAPSASAQPSSRVETVVTDLEASLRYSWRQLVSAQELAKPGFMTLCAIRHDGEIVDFEWDYVNPAAARMFLGSPRRMVGQRLLESSPGNERLSAVFAHYRRVVDGVTPETLHHEHAGNGIDDAVRHVATRLGDGVAVTLSNLTAAARADALRVELMRHQERLQWQARDDSLRERRAAVRTRPPDETPPSPDIGLCVPQSSARVIGQPVRRRFLHGVGDFLARCHLIRPGAIGARSFG